MDRGASRIGAGGEFLACAILAELGWTASPVNADGFDLMAVRGRSLLRVQVKATLRLQHKRTSYQWSVSRSKPKRSLTIEDCDVVAAVALDIRRAWFIHVNDVQNQTTVRLPLRQIILEDFEQETWEAALRATSQKT